MFKRIIRKYLLRQNISKQMCSKPIHNLTRKVLNISVGMGSYGYLKMPSGTKVGNYCSIADGVKYLSGNHPMDHITTAACFYNPALGFVSKEFDIERTSLEIQNDVWIGANVLITNKVTCIPNGVVVGAGAVLTKNPEPYGIYVGNPAKLLRKRFDDNIIQCLEKSRWWLLSPNEILRFKTYLDKPIEFIARIKTIIK